LRRNAVTLVEVVVALSLSALLLVALTGVLTGLARQNKASTAIRSGQWHYELDQLFWVDLAQCRGVALDKGVLWMVRPKNKSTKVSTADTSATQTVAYRLKPDRSEQGEPQLFSLVRQIFEGDKLLGRPILEQTLVWDVRRASFERIDNAGNEQPIPNLLGPPPRAFRYQLWIGNEERSQSNRIIVR